MAIQYAVLFSLVLLSVAHPPPPPPSSGSAEQGPGRHGPGRHGPPPPPPPGIGPLGPVLRNLTSEQRDQLMNITRNAHETNETKGELKKQIDAFVATLSSDLQAKVKEVQAEMDQHLANDTARVANLSSDAQALFKNVQSVLQDDSLTEDQTREKVDALVQAASQSVTDEFRQAHIPLPGLHPPGPPPPGPRGSHSRGSSEEQGPRGYHSTPRV
ncbi:hypothetical protein M3Y98_00093100 [Aphelenchoides besseyi]|nr:hypothetical protein M3Y98_00093100 [Aphelenchoides besseyi]KAI6198532.1 hypothetical protein M3Y96_00529100 [Aphelenchoides besseyi]